MIENTLKTKKSAIFLKKIATVKKTNENKIIFIRKFLITSGCACFNAIDDTTLDEVIKKAIYIRGINGSIRDGFKDGFNIDKCVEFLEANIENIEETYITFDIDKNLRRDFKILCKSISLQFKNFVEIKDESVYDTVKDLYRDLIISDDNKDTLIKRKMYFENLKSSDKRNINSYLKKIKNCENVTIFFDKSNSRKFYDVFVCNNIAFHSDEENVVIIENISIPKLLNFTNTHLFLEASGGVGKTMMMKHLLLSAIYNFDEHFLLPIFINLRDYQNEISFDTFILNQVNSILESPISKESLASLLDNGQCLILLDGLDEINSEFLYEFDKQITLFGTRFNKNYIIISSRPHQNSDYLNTFKKIFLKTFTKNQASLLIEKLEYKPETPEIAIEFIDMLNKKLYEKNKEFCENPLLLTIMLMTYDKTGLPESKHEFYEKAYWALSEKYNPYRGKRHGVLYTKLTPARFLEVLSRFAFETYHDYKFSFTTTEIESYISKIKQMSKFSGETFSYKEFIKDLTNHLCLFHKNGKEYLFVHRSLQEFFCAKYFSTQSANKYLAIGRFIDERDSLQAAKSFKQNKFIFFFEEYVYDMFYAMNPVFFEELILIPILRDYLKTNSSNLRDEFLYFLTKCYDHINYEIGNVSENFNLPKMKSNIISKLINNFNEENMRKNIEISLKYPDFFVSSYVTSSSNEVSVYSFKTSFIYKNKDKYNDLITELENSILYKYFLYVREIYLKLISKYQLTKEISLKNILE